MLFNEVMIELRGKLEVFLRYFLLEILLTSHFLVLLLDLLESGQLDPFRLLFTELKQLVSLKLVPPKHSQPLLNGHFSFLKLLLFLDLDVLFDLAFFLFNFLLPFFLVLSFVKVKYLLLFRPYFNLLLILACLGLILQLQCLLLLSFVNLQLALCFSQHLLVAFYFRVNLFDVLLLFPTDDDGFDTVRASFELDQSENYVLRCLLDPLLGLFVY